MPARGEQHYAWKGDAATPKAKRLRAQRSIPLALICDHCTDPAVDRHHIDEDPGNNDPANIASLCRRCHMKADRRLDALLESRQEMYERLRSQEFCKRGHSLTDPKNVYRRPDRPSTRGCRKCRAEAERRRKQRIREEGNRHHQKLHSALRTLEEPPEWKPCPHPPGTHRYPGAREACERKLNRDLSSRR